MFSRSYSLALGLALLTTMPAVTPAREFRVADTQPADYPTVQALQYMAQIIEERSAGRHRLHVFHSRQLGEEKETIEQTRIGRFHGVLAVHGLTDGRASAVVEWAKRSWRNSSRMALSV